MPAVELLERLGQLFQRGEVSHPEPLFLEGAEEVPDAALGWHMAKLERSWRFRLADCDCRCGASRWLSRISRSTHRIDVRTSRTRSRAYTLRWASPWRGDSWMLRRISIMRSSSLERVLGPRRAAAGRGAGSAARRRSTVAGPTPSAPERRPQVRPVEAERARLIWRDVHRRKA